MENKSHALAAGLFVVLLTALVIFLSLWMGRDNTNYTRYELSTRETVSGLQPQAAVRYKGVAVGRVTKIEFDPARDGTVLIIIAVNAEAPISQTTYAMLGYQGVTGLAHIQLDDGARAQDPLPRGPSGLPRLRMRSSPLNMLADQGPVLLERVDEISKRLNAMLGEGNQQRFSVALENIGTAAASINKLANSLNESTAQLPQLTQEAKSTLRSLSKAGDSASAVAGELQKTVRVVNAPNGPLAQMSQGTQALTDVAQSLDRSTVPRINRTADDVSRSVRQMSNTVSRFGENPQSLIYGGGPVAPGPGEPGFVAPSVPAQP